MKLYQMAGARGLGRAVCRGVARNMTLGEAAKDGGKRKDGMKMALRASCARKDCNKCYSRHCTCDCHKVKP